MIRTSSPCLPPDPSPLPYPPAITGVVIGAVEVVDDLRDRLLLGGDPDVLGEQVVLGGRAIGEHAAGSSQ